MYSKIILAGGSGQIGTALKTFFESKTAEIIILSRNPENRRGNIKPVYWDGETLGKWTNELEGADLIVNLTGKSVNCRFTEENKIELTASRINSVKVIGKAIEGLKKPPLLWVQFTGIDGYSNDGFDACTEQSPFNGVGFLAELSQKWELAFDEATKDLPNLRKVKLRTSMVLAKNSGVYPRLKLLVKWWLGGPHGNGNQWVSWIHEADECRLVDWIAQHKQMSGAINCTAPYPISNADFMAAFRKAAEVWIGLPTPTFAVKWGTRLMGTEPDLILNSRRAVPKIALESGFQFAFPRTRDAIKQIYERGRYRK